MTDSEVPTNLSVPQDVTAERALLGALLLNPDALGELAWVQPEHFYLHKHRWIFDAILAVAADGLTPDTVTLCAELERRGHLAEVGGLGYLVRLIGECTSSLHALSYARLVEREAMRRRLILAATEIAKLAYDGRRELGTVLSDAQAALAAVTERGRVTALTARDVAPEVWETVAYPERQAARMIPTGLAAWDETLGGGLERGTLTVLMARPGMGKTATLVQIADYVTEPGGTVAVFSLEMTSRQWLLRTACRRARVSVLALKQGRAGDDQRGRVLQELAALTERSALVLDDTPQTTDDLLATCDRLAQAGDLRLVIADHLRLFSDRGENENKRLGGISWALKKLAKALDVPVLAAAQLSRGVEQAQDKRPDLKDLRDSGEIEENADNVTALYRDGYYNNNPLDNTAELINRKARDGERNARARLVYLAPFMSFESLAGKAERP